MRILLGVGLVTYWVTHPAVVHHLLRLAALAVGALAHLGSDHATLHSAAGTILELGSHWH